MNLTIQRTEEKGTDLFYKEVESFVDWKDQKQIKKNKIKNKSVPFLVSPFLKNSKAEAVQRQFDAVWLDADVTLISSRY